MHLLLNLLSRLLPFPKGRLFFIFRFIFFQWNVFILPFIIVFFILLYEAVGLKTQCIFLLSLYMFCNPPQKSSTTLFKPFIVIISFMFNFALLASMLYYA